ncbi:hypothetical protein BG011_003702 [Mortierella polycephala]|uniref:FAR-17a/AIG1-like protein n=1 Tax=Mortierella polycephala TaxID=41804 RepID=A0A9P6Q0B9_9FUNG|nr:hypothetical protein BG011_003702 [Mortierella polycephala]
MSFIARALKLDRFEPDRIVTSNLVHPITLAILRGILCVYALIVIISVWATSKSIDGYLKYFTNLTYFGLVTYLVPAEQREQWLKRGSPWWGWLHWLLYTTVVTYHIVVPLVYWTMLNVSGSSADTVEVWQNVSVHALDGVFAVFELIFNRHFLQPIHSFVVAGVMVLYMLLTFLAYADKGTWVYPFLDWSQGAICVAYYFGIAIGLFIIFFILLALHRIRNRLLARRCAVVNKNEPLEAFQSSHQEQRDQQEQQQDTQLDFVQPQQLDIEQGKMEEYEGK